VLPIENDVNGALGHCHCWRSRSRLQTPTRDAHRPRFVGHDDSTTPSGPGLRPVPARRRAYPVRGTVPNAAIALSMPRTVSLRAASRAIGNSACASSSRPKPSSPGANVNDRERDNQIHRARVLEVRIHLPPAKSLQTISSAARRLPRREQGATYRQSGVNTHTTSGRPPPAVPVDLVERSAGQRRAVGGIAVDHIVLIGKHRAACDRYSGAIFGNH
jgi:hypothetical protein